MTNNQKKLNEQLVKVVLDTKTCDEVRIKRAKYLIRLGADINARNDGYSMIELAVLQKNAEMVRVLAENGAKLDIKCNSDEMLVEMAVRKREVEIVRVLAENGANLDVRDKSDYPVLQLAIWGSDVEMVRVLVENGADIMAKNRDGNNMIDEANRIKNDAIIGILKNAQNEKNGGNEQSGGFLSKIFGCKSR